jgi:tRNA(fMet)-specific endonuclease VapC
MTMTYLLDTNILSALIIDPQGPVGRRIERAGARNVYTSIVVAAEMRFGAAKRQSERLTDRIEQLLRRIRIAALELPADEAYGHIRADLERAGTPIGGNDLLIAAQALASGSVLVSDNTREFSRVAGLKIENWLSN